jgi:DNA (cytosine-5)-methyltransferase 1
MLNKPLTFIDLFCGCGGFSLGLMRAGYHCVAAIDADEVATQVFRENLSEFRHPKFKSAKNVLKRDITYFPPEDLAKLTGKSRVDVIVGGPPCQGFSTARQVDGANHGKRLKHDERRYLYQHFLRYVEFFQPKVFVMENVLGMRSAAGGRYFTQVQKEARELGGKSDSHGYRVHTQIEDAWKLGAPQKRRRQLIVGVRRDIASYMVPEVEAAPDAQPYLSLGVAIGDLPPLAAGSGTVARAYDPKRRTTHLAKCGRGARKFFNQVLEVSLADQLTGHVARPHNDRDLRDFARLKEGESSAVAMRKRGVKFEFPYSKESFKDRYTRQSRFGPCSTIVAHLSKDGLMFIHPTQNRSLTPREAARIQTFPDWFSLPASRSHAFRLVGNAVPPLVAEAVGIHIHEFLGAHGISRKTAAKKKSAVSGAQKKLAQELQKLAQLSLSELRRLSTDEFRRGWHALLSLFPHLHPSNAREHGTDIEESFCQQDFHTIGRQCYSRSGWPVTLVLIGQEAWRRAAAGSLPAKHLYLSGASIVRQERLRKVSA